ncbi:MAG: acyl-CoA dehydrogenase domain protein [Massilia sp.]|jgi:alkylation response protein AidB-like acyl-CoA dehydrogenase|nr:acyl-CoA dehydrogenase domain protein [Massilia sp.]MDB5948974.1 acyl-CoA dehydrogenase domain protein [Massilia sp.]
MNEYIAPLKDMHFLLHDMAGLSQVHELPAYDEVDAALVEAVLEEAGKFAHEVLSPLNRTGDQEGARLGSDGVRMPKGWPEAFKQFSEGGWTSLSASKEFGGQQLPQLVAAFVEEIWNGANLAFTLSPMLIRCAQQVLESRGTEEQKRTYLPNLVSGVWSGTMALTEPHAGSDVGAIKSKAVKQPDGSYRLTGQKIFITYGDHDMTENIVHLVLARVEAAPEGSKGISLFIVPKILLNADGSLGAPNDVRAISLEHKMGIHASPTCVMAFGEGAGATAYLVGEQNRGLENMFVMMNAARFAVGLEAVGISERAYQLASDYAKERVQGTEIGSASGERVAIIKHPDVRRMLLSMKSRVEAMRAISCSIAVSMDIAGNHPSDASRRRHQGLVELLMPIAKGWFTENAVDITSQGIQVHGGMGYIEETGAAQFYRDSRISAIYEGTTGIQANDLVSRKVARDGGTTIRTLIDEMKHTTGQLAQSEDGALSAIGTLLREGVAGLEVSVNFIVTTFSNDQRKVFAGAVPFLDLFGTVVGGWELARCALVAAEKLNSSDQDQRFYFTKIQTARFYADHILINARSLANSVVNGHHAILTLDETYF